MKWKFDWEENEMDTNETERKRVDMLFTDITKDATQVPSLTI